MTEKTKEQEGEYIIDFCKLDKEKRHDIKVYKSEDGKQGDLVDVASFPKRYWTKKIFKTEVLEFVNKYKKVNENTLKITLENKFEKPKFKIKEKENYQVELSKKPVTLKDVHKSYRFHLHIEDTKRIDIVLATFISSKLPGIPIWLILVGPSGDMKSMQLNAIRTKNTYVLHNLTSKTLVNGYKDKLKHPDLAPLLNGQVVLSPDLAQILKLPPIEKAELWGQLRDLYDGFAGKSSGQGADTKYEGLKVTLLAASTPNIDGQILIHQDLGTRELIYRTSGNKDKEKLMDKCFENEEKEAEVLQELRNITTSFLEQTEPRRVEVSNEIIKEIKVLSRYISYMRSSAEYDNYTNELRNFVYPEEPSRIAKQLKRVYVCLKSLTDDYPDSKAMAILWHLAQSSAFPVRVKLFEYFIFNPGEEKSTSQISQDLKIGKSTAKRECLVLESLGLIECRRAETTYPDKFYEYWKIPKSMSEPSKLIIYTILNKYNNKENKEKIEYSMSYFFGQFDDDKKPDVEIEEVEDFPIKRADGKGFKQVDPTLRPCFICSETHSKGWTLEDRQGKIYCDICAGQEG